MPTYRPRRSATAASDAPTICVPPNSTLPVTCAVAGSRPIMARAIIDLPEPDEPTKPTRSPSAMSKSTSSTIGLPLMAMFR